MKRILFFLLLPLLALGQQNSARMLSGVFLPLGTNYPVVPIDATRLLAFVNTNPVAVTLSSGNAAGFGAGVEFAMQNISSPSVTITCTGCLIFSNGAAGASTLSLSPGAGVELYSAGLNYYTLSLGGGGGGGGGTLAGVANQIVIASGTVGLANPTIHPGAATFNGPVGVSNVSNGIYTFADPFCAFQGVNSQQDMLLCDLYGIGPVFNNGDGTQTLAYQLNKIQQGGYQDGQFNAWHATNGDFEPPPVTISPETGVITQNANTGGTIVSGALVPSQWAQYVSFWCGSTTTCSNGAVTDESVAIQAAITSLGAKSTVHIVDDMCGIQTWSVQPFAGPGNNNMAGVFEFKGNCPPSNPHIVSVDGMSTVLIPTGVWILGQGTAIGGATPQYGGVGNSAIGTYIRACNPKIYPCVNGGFVVQSGAITTTGALASNLSLVTMTAKPFTFSGTAFNNLQQYRMIQISGSATLTNNAAWVVSDCNTTGCNTNPQTFHITAPSGFINCAASCGTAYLDTPVIAIGTGGSNGVFGVQVQNLTIDCSYMPGTIGWVNAIGQELSGVRDVNAWDCMVAGGRIDQSVAYNGQTFASSNSGPYGPLSSNFENVTCGLTGGCGCMGNSTGCSSVVNGTAGTVAKGTAMSCGASGSLATISLTSSSTAIDPCVNSNFHNFLWTGSLGQQGFGPMFHVTASMSDKSAGGGGCVPEMCQATTGSNIYGDGGIAGTTFACAMGFYGIHGLVLDYHHEYALGGLCVGGDAARTGTFYYAYTNTTAPAANVITSGVVIDGGFAGATGASVEIDIGSQKSDAPFIGSVDIRNWNMQNGGSAIDVQNNVNGQNCKSYGAAPGGDYVLKYYFGPSTTGTNPGQTGLAMPHGDTSCSQLAAFTGNAFAIPLVSTGALSNYGVPVKADTSNAGQYVQTITTDTAAGIVMGVSFHPTAAGGFGDVVTTGVVTMMFGTSGTGNCAIGNFVIVDSVTNGHVKCTAAYSAGTVIGVALQAMSTTNTAFNVLVGLR